MPASFDPADYVRSPIITVSTGVALGQALVDAAPPQVSPIVAKALATLTARVAKARTDLEERNRALGTFSDEDSRALDNEADRAWGGLRMRLQAISILNHATYPNAKRAAELDTMLFSQGTEFLKADFPTQSTSTGAILGRLDADGLAADLDLVAGVEFLQAIRNVQPRYETMVSERLRRDKATGQNLLDTTRELQSAISTYAQKLIGAMDDDDAASVETTRLALRPIVNHRETSGAKRTVIDAPVPEPTPPANPT